MAQTREGFCQMLRRCVADSTERRQTKAAVFYAEKLYTLSPTPEDVFVYAQALYDNQEFRSAAATLLKHGLTMRNARFAALTGRSLLGCNAYEECLSQIGGEDQSDDRDFDEPPAQSPSGWTAALFVIRALAWEGLENLEMSVLWYKRALKLDPCCYEAFHALVERHLLSPKEGGPFFEGLSCNSEMTWIKALYSCINAKYSEDFPKELGKLKDVARLIGPATPLRPSDHTNRSLHSQSDSHQSSSSPGIAEQSESSDSEMDSDRRGLVSSVDVKLASAEWHYSRGANVRTFLQTEKILHESEEMLQVYPLHLATCLELQKTSDIYVAGQKLAKLCPETALAFYAFGVYYMSIENYAEARKAFTRSNNLDRYFAPAWIGLGNAFAAQSETEQALVAYRTARTLFPGLHLPSVYIGMENLRLNLLENAQVNFETAYNLCPGDPLPLCQLGIVAYHRGQYNDAAELFMRALQRIPDLERSPQWEPIYINLGHSMRKQMRYKEALVQYNHALGLCPFDAGTHNAIGFVYHLQKKYRKAAESYIRALLYDPHNAFAAEMSKMASNEAMGVAEDLFDD